MKPGEAFFEDRQPALNERSGELLRASDLHTNALGVIRLLRERKVVLPGLAHLRTAIARTLESEGITLPRGQTYGTRAYDTYTVDDTVDEKSEEAASTFSPKLSFSSRVYNVTNDDTDEGRFTRRMNELLDGKPARTSGMLIQTITPNSVGNVFDLESIMFVVVRVQYGKTYCLRISPNENKGKVIPEYGLQSEYGQMRDTTGYIDRCPIKAELFSPEKCLTINEELRRVKEMLEREKPAPQPNRREQLRRKVGTVGTRMTKTFSQTFRSVNTKE